MFNPNSAIDNPSAMRYVAGEENPFNAWWGKEEISTSTTVRDLVRGDKVEMNGRTLYVAGKFLEPGTLQVQTSWNGPAFELSCNAGDRVIFIATRGEMESRKAR